LTITIAVSPKKKRVHRQKAPREKKAPKAPIVIKSILKTSESTYNKKRIVIDLDKNISLEFDKEEPSK
jgi:hypothetical protein